MKITYMTHRLICIFMIFLMCIFPVTAEQAENLAVSSGTHSIEAGKSVLSSDQLITNAESVILYEMKTDTLMYSWNADAKMYPASLVKIMTALIAVEKGNLSDLVTVKKDVIDTIPFDAVSSGLQPDEMISLKDLLYCMMVGSGNDAAAVIADYISGNQETFISLMNQYAQELGCNGTQFMNVHGLHHDDQYTTARDMCRILRKALENSDFSAVFSAVKYTVSATNKSAERTMVTSNYLMSMPDGMELYFDSRVTGGRTGVTTDGTRCLAASAENNGLQLISIVMGSESVYNDGESVARIYGGFKETTELLDLGFNGYKTVQVLYDGQILTQRPVVDGNNNVILGAKKSMSAVLPADITMENLSVKYFDLNAQISAPINMGDVLSQVQIWYGDICVAQADLVAMNTVRSVNVQNAQVSGEPPTDYISIIITIIIIAIACAAVFFAVVYIRGRLHKAAARKRSQRYRRYRRRSR